MYMVHIILFILCIVNVVGTSDSMCDTAEICELIPQSFSVTQSPFYIFSLIKELLVCD